MNIQGHFIEFIACYENIIQEDERNKLINECYNLSKHDKAKGGDNWNCDVFTSHGSAIAGDLNHFALFNNLIHQMKTQVVEYASFLGNNILYSDLYASGCWFNISTKGQYQEYHLHTDSSYSSIFYLNGGKDFAKTVFARPYNRHNNIENADSDITKYEAVAGRHIIFGSHIPHYTEQHNIEKNRLTIATNWRVNES